MSKKNKNFSERKTSTLTLIFRFLSVILINTVPVYGVFRLGWNSIGLVLLFIVEGVIVLFTDIIKFQFLKNKQKVKINLLIEFCFIIFYGFFALLVYGPYESLENMIADRMLLVIDLIVVDLGRPLLIIAFIRLVRLVQDLLNAGVFKGSGTQPLNLEGGSFMLLLFFMVMAAPIVAGKGPNPLGGLMVLVLLKIAGDILLVWFSRNKF
ncbi:hypothetical protein JXQ31_03205 [candidate division KSB1 bacterium]|nr:hypothetical protein [candidate division KSB1 bacterium]